MRSSTSYGPIDLPSTTGARHLATTPRASQARAREVELDPRRESGASREVQRTACRTFANPMTFRGRRSARLMRPRTIEDRRMKNYSALKWTARAIGVAAGAYAGYAGATCLRYGHPKPARGDDVDTLL